MVKKLISILLIVSTMLFSVDPYLAFAGEAAPWGIRRSFDIRHEATSSAATNSPVSSDPAKIRTLSTFVDHSSARSITSLAPAVLQDPTIENAPPADTPAMSDTGLGPDVTRAPTTPVLTPAGTPVPATTPTAESLLSLDELFGGDMSVFRKRVQGVSPDPQIPLSSTRPSTDGDDGSLQNVLKTVNVNSSTGSAGVSIPLQLPEGRAGMGPALALNYAPGQGNGPFGLGWSLGLGAITRSTKDGVPRYDGTDTFTAEIGGQSYDLVNVGNHEYRARVEQDFLTFSFQDTMWEVKDRSGTRYLFGSRSGSNIAQGDRIFSWRLDRVEDLTGNFFVVNYFPDKGFEIRYGLKTTKSRPADVDSADNFAYVVRATSEARTGADVKVDRRSGFEIRDDYLVTEVSVFAAGNLLRKYVFDYAPSKATGWSLLRKVTQVGTDGKTQQVLGNFRYADDVNVNYSNNTVDDPLKGDNLWNYRFTSGLFGSNSKDPVPGFVGLGDDHTQRSGSWEKASWEISEQGDLMVTTAADAQHVFYTYLYVDEPKTITSQVEIEDLNSFGRAIWGAYLNGDYNKSVGTTWELKKGYNLVVVTLFHTQLAIVRSRLLILPEFLPKMVDYTFRLHLNFTDHDQADLMNSRQVVYPQLVADFNGDGFGDSATYFSSSDTFKVALSSNGAFLPKATWLEGFAHGGPFSLGDYNGDGRADIAVFDRAERAVRVALSDGTKFVDSGVWLSGAGADLVIPQGGADVEISVGEFDGDGRSDLYMISRPGPWSVRVARSTGSGFEPVYTNDNVAGSARGRLTAVDMNGDGLSDIVNYDPSDGSVFVLKNAGKYDHADGSYSDRGFWPDKEIFFSDMDQDGRVDIGYLDTAQKRIVYRRSVPDGFAPQQTLDVSLTLADEYSRVQVADFNGDGLNDIFVFDAFGRSNMLRSSGAFRDILTSYDNGSGGRVKLDYISSTSLDNTYLPFALPVVKGMTVENGLGDSVRTRYDYKKGFWDPAAREFFGFGEVRVTDALGNYATTQFLQDNIYTRWQPAKIAVYGHDGTLHQETRYTYLNEPVVSGRDDVRFVAPERVDSLVYDTPTAGLRTAVVTTYNAVQGLPTETRDMGEVDFSTGNDTGNDLLRSTITYNNNPGAGLVGLPAHRAVYDQKNVLLGQEWFYYDGAAQTTVPPVKGLLTRKEVWNKYEGVESRVSTETDYNAFGLPVSVRDANGHTSKVAYDGEYGIFTLSGQNAAGHEVSSAYYGVNGVALDGQPWGALKSTTDPNERKGVFTYDALGRVRTMIGPLDSADLPTLSYEYIDRPDYRAVVTRQRVEHGETPTLDSYVYYDGLGRPVCRKTPSAAAGQSIVSGQSVSNDRGETIKTLPPYLSSKGIDVMEKADPGAAGKEMSYDDLGRVIEVRYPDGTRDSFTYTTRGRGVTDANGHYTWTGVDARGRVVLRQEFKGSDGRASGGRQASDLAVYAETHYAYDTAGNLLSVTDAAGNVTRMTYDALGHKRAMRDVDMGPVTYDYLPSGTLTRQRDALNNVTSFTYDTIDRPVTRAVSLGGNDLFHVTTPDVSYLYDTSVDAKGRITRARYGADQTTFAYDALGQETASTKTIDGEDFTIHRAYDAMSRVKALVYSDNNKAVYSYNAAGQLDKVTFVPASGSARVVVSGIDYTASGQMTRVRYGNGVTAAYEYDPLTFRLTSQKIMGPDGGNIQENLYAYDNVGQLTRLEERVTGTVKTFAYDDLGRLVSFNDGNGAVAYAYDATGNITRKGGLAYTYGENGAGPHAVTSISDGTTMTYDAAGNMITQWTPDKKWYYAYDQYNRLVKVWQQGPGRVPRSLAVEFSYDGDGGRTRRVDHLSRGRVTYYVGDVYEETDGRGVDHIFLGTTRVARYSNGALHWFIGDHLGSTTAVLDEDGSLTERIAYTPWGEVSSHTRSHAAGGDDASSLYFTGKPVDDATGLVFFGARYYVPKLGRWLTPDTTVQDPLNPQTLNRYAYCNNNPVNLVDPLGYGWIKKYWKTIVTVAVGITVGILTAGIGSIAFFPSMVGGSTFWGGVLSTAVSGALAGAAAGGVGAGLYGQDIGQSMLRGAAFGALSGAVFGGMIGKFGGKNWNWRIGLERVGLSTVAGGGISELAGGSFKDGAMFAGAVAGADFIYRAIVSTAPQGKNISASMRMAEENGQQKIFQNEDGSWREVTLNDRKFNSVGFASRGTTSGLKYFFGDETGPVMSTLGRSVPGMQGMALAHDVTVGFTATLLRSGSLNMLTFNFPTMPILYGINALGSIINDSPGMIGYYESSQNNN